jgi:hypothetical protein
MENVFEDEPQEEFNWCWAAVTASVRSYLMPDKPMKQCEIATAILNKDCCSEPLPTALDVSHTLGDVLTQFAPATEEARALSFDEVKKQIDASLPICAYIEWPGGRDCGHFIVLIGYGEADGKWIDVADPFFGYQCLPFESLRTAYQGIGSWTYSYLIKAPAAAAVAPREEVHAH